MLAQFGSRLQRILMIRFIKKRTGRTETSQYPQEKKSTEIPKVAASEIGPGQWILCKNENGMESPAKVGDSPVSVESIRFLE